jgi:hypothetical protein
VVGKVISNITRITLYISTITFGGRSPSVKILARRVCSDTDPDLVLVPSDFWTVNFQARLERLLKNEDKFPEDIYTGILALA